MNPDSLSYLALGDSYTIGESVATDQRWPVQLADSLRRRGYSMAEPHIIARTGWTTDELQAGIARENPEGPFTLVSLLIGVNNQYRGRSVENFREQFRELLIQAIGFADGNPSRVIVLSIPDWGVTPFAGNRDRDRIASEIDTFNRVKREETENANAHFIPITGISRQAADDRSLIAGDGLHPSGKMYQLWVEAALPLVESILRQLPEPK